MSNNNLKRIKCVTCDEMRWADIHAPWIQCGACVMSDKPNPFKHNRPPECEGDNPNQLELGEVAS